MWLVETTQNKAFYYYNTQKLDIGEEVEKRDWEVVIREMSPGEYGVREVQRRELPCKMRTITWKSLLTLAKVVEVMGIYSSVKSAKEWEVRIWK